MSKRNIVILTHSSAAESKKELFDCVNDILNQLKDADASFDVMQMDESTPKSLKARAEMIQWSSVLIVLASYDCQYNYECMEAVHYTHSLRQPVVVAYMHKQPKGGLAAIGMHHEALFELPSSADSFKQHILHQAQAKSSSTLLCSALMKQTQAMDAIVEARNGSASTQRSTSATSNTRVLISFTPDAVETVNIIESILAPVSSCTRLDASKPISNEKKIAVCSVFIVVMSPGLEKSEQVAMRDLDTARQLRKFIIPVKGDKGFRPRVSWLALGAAGKLYFLMKSLEAVDKPFFDSSIRKDFMAAVKMGLTPKLEEGDREKLKMQVLEKKLTEVKEELHKLNVPWPTEGSVEDSSAEEVVGQSNAATLPPAELWPDESVPLDPLEHHYTNYSVTRTEISVPKQLFDAHGVPIQQQFDVMISYQWDQQAFVRKFYENLNIRNVHAWFDIWGGMQGNVFESMARGVESSHMILCFLTAAYQKSANCLLELKYAVFCNKPIIFLVNLPVQEESLQSKYLELVNASPEIWKPAPLPWLADLMRKSLVLPLRSEEDLAFLDRARARNFWLVEAIQKVIAHEKKRKGIEMEWDESDKVRQLQEEVNCGLAALHLAQGTERWLTCTRCGVKYDAEENKSGLQQCRKHRSYYMGGTIIAGRYTCCEQKDKNAPGCAACEHTNEPVEFKQMPDYPGCFRWYPE